MTRGGEPTIQDVLAELQAVRDLLEPKYCRADEHCPGGVLLRHHAPDYWKNDGDDGDRFYHVLPESGWYRYSGDGAFKGNLVKNHNVWRSDTTTAPQEEGGDAPERTDVDTRTGEVMKPAAEHLIADIDITMDKAAQTYLSTRATNGGLKSPQLMAYLGIDQPASFWPAVDVWLQHNSPRNVFEEGVALLVQAVAAANAPRAGARR